LSFFDEGEDDAPLRSTSRSAPRPRRPASTGGPHPPDRQTLLVRRGVAFLAALILIFLVVVGISSCERSAAHGALTTYNSDVTQIAEHSDTSVSAPFFSDLLAANGKSGLEVEVELNQLHDLAQSDVARAQQLSVPGDMEPAQRDLVLALNFRAEAVGAVSNLIIAALGGQSAGGQTAGQAIKLIAGQMEALLSSDVIYSQRVAPLITQTLASDGVSGQVVYTSRWVHDLGWLLTSTVSSRLTGVSGTGVNGQPLAPGTHGHRLAGVSVGANTLGTSVNHIPSGPNPTFTVLVDNDSDNAATDVQVSVSVTSGGRTTPAATYTIARTEPGKTYSVHVPVTGVPLQTPAQVKVEIKSVPGEKNTANNRASYTAIFSS
jgi:hypothetical protein